MTKKLAEIEMNHPIAMCAAMSDLSDRETLLRFLNAAYRQGFSNATDLFTDVTLRNHEHTDWMSLVTPQTRELSDE